MITYGDHTAGFIVAASAGCNYNPHSDAVISIAKDGRLVGGVIYTNYCKRTVSCHIAGFRPNWMTREFLRVIFDYPFNQLGVESILVDMAAANTDALDFVANLGFKEVARVPDVYVDGDMVLMRMFRHECRFLGIKPHGQAVQHATAA